MSAIQRILCPTDFSDTAHEAVKYAEQLARDVDADLYLVHAFDTPVSLTLSGQEHPRDPEIEKQLDALLVESAHFAKIRRRQQAGIPGEVICWLAQDLKCDLIVMSTHGRTGLKHLLFGSVAEYVMQHARCPVLTVRDRDPNEPPLVRPNVLPVMAPRYM